MKTKNLVLRGAVNEKMKNKNKKMVQIIPNTLSKAVNRGSSKK